MVVTGQRPRAGATCAANAKVNILLGLPAGKHHHRAGM
jgi:hypothetical protein